MHLNLIDRGKAGIRGERRPWSLVTRLAVYYTICATALLLIAMWILYAFVVQHINADDNQFLADTLRSVKADLAEKHSNSDRLFADEVPPGTTDYFVRILDQRTNQVIAERPAAGDRASPSIFPVPPPDGRIPTEGVEYKSPSGHWYFLMTASAVLDSDSPRPVVIQVAQDGSDEKAFMQNFGKLLLGVLTGGIICSATIVFFTARRALRPLEEMARKRCKRRNSISVLAVADGQAN